jgi:protein-arginine kinase activator protein McsA
MFRNTKNPFVLLNDFTTPFGSFDPFTVLLGDVKTEKGQDENGQWTSQTYTSENGVVTVKNFTRTSKSPKSKTTTNTTTTNTTTNTTELTTLQNELTTAIETQNFERAVELRDQIKKLESNQEKIETLTAELETSIKEQYFEKSIKLRDQINKLTK